MAEDLLTLAMVQTDIVWNQVSVNLERIDQLLDTIGEAVDVVVLPETFATGFITKPDPQVPDRTGEVVRWMTDKARQMDAMIMGSHASRLGAKMANRLFAVKPDGEVLHYDKRHLFTMGGEDAHFERGESPLLIEFRGWKLFPLICYDLRFPVWSRNVHGYDLLIYVANWPHVRRIVWDTLVPARAIENQSYALGVNRIGPDAHGTAHSGGSQLVSPEGELLHRMDGSEGVAVKRISRTALLKLRERFPVLRDADGFRLGA